MKRCSEKMFVDAGTILGIFGTWWGFVEFLILIALVAIVSLVGVFIIENYYVHQYEDRSHFIDQVGKISLAHYDGTISEIPDQQVVKELEKQVGEAIKTKGISENIDPLLKTSIIEKTARHLGLKISSVPFDTSNRKLNSELRPDKRNQQQHQQQRYQTENDPFKVIQLRIDTKIETNKSAVSIMTVE